MLVSFSLASNRSGNFTKLCGNLESTAADPTCLEVLVAIDDGDEPMHQCIAREKARRPFAIKALSNPGGGYFSLWKALNELHRLCDPDAYFVCNINDEIHFKTRHWDEALRKYVGLFPDHIFRLRVSRFKLRNYVDFWECGYAPENYAFFTKRWIDLQGNWNACHGPDAFQQFVAYYLARGTYPAKEQVNRDVPILDIELAGEGAFFGLSPEQHRERIREGWIAWYRLVSHAMQTECFRRARRIHAYVVANTLGLRDFEIQDDRARRQIVLKDGAGKRILADAEGFPLIFPYRLNRLKIGLANLLRRPIQGYYCGGDPQLLRQQLRDLPTRFFPISRQLAFFPDDPIGGIKWIFNRPSERVRKGKPGASDWADAHPPIGLVDGSPEPWGSAETRDDTYFYITRDKAFEARRIDIVLFSPRGRSHLKDVSVVAGNKLRGSIDEWVVIPARTRGMRGYAEKVVIPDRHDFTRIRIKLDRTSIPDGGFNTYGLACFSTSRGYDRNHLPEGHGIYVREMVVIA